MEFGTGDVEFSSRALESVRREMKLALEKRSFRGDKWIWTRIEVEFWRKRSEV